MLHRSSVQSLSLIDSTVCFVVKVIFRCVLYIGRPYWEGEGVLQHFRRMLFLDCCAFVRKALCSKCRGQQVRRLQNELILKYYKCDKYLSDQIITFVCNFLRMQMNNNITHNRDALIFVDGTIHFWALRMYYFYFRAIIVRNNEIIPMSNEFTPESERQRLQYLVSFFYLH